MYESFKEGSIISLKLENFQTYKKSEFLFHPNLNFIAGPNGSGKSSIANAIAFIFGGSPGTIGKTKEISEYVNFNSMEAKIEATIKHNEKLYTLKRILKRDTKKTNWYINNEEKKQQDYLNFIQKLGIDVNNLCMFLPQEKVSEFAGLSPEELLVQTLESQPDTSISKNIKKLMIYESNKNNVSQNIISTMKTKEGIGEIVENLSKDVQKLKEKNDLQEKIKNMKIKKRWLTYELISEEYQKLKLKIKEYEKTISTKEKEVEEIKNKIDEIMNSEELKKIKENKKKVEKMNEEIYRTVLPIKNCMKNIELLEIDLKGLENKKESRKNELENLKRKLAETQKKIGLIKIEEVKKCTQQLKEIENLNEEILDLEMSKSGLEKKSREIQLKLEKLQIKRNEHGKEENRRMEYLEKYHPDTFKAVHWLRRNKNLFKDEIIEPPILSLKIKDNRFIKEVETFLSFQILSSFIVKNKEDFETFIRILKDEKKLGINVLERFTDKKRNVLTKDQLNEAGFEVMLIDLIEDREEVLDMLNVCGHFYAIPVTKNSVDEEKFFLKYENIRRMASRNKYIEIKRSIYNKNDYVLSEIALKGINLLSPHTTEGISQINEEIKQLDLIRNENYTEHTKLVSNLEEKKEVLEKKKRILNEQNEIFNEMERRKAQREFYLRSIENYTSQINSLEDFNDLQKEKEEIFEKIKHEKSQIKNFSEELNEVINKQNVYEELKIIKHLETEIHHKNVLINQEKNKKAQIEGEINNLKFIQDEFIKDKNDKCKELDRYKESLKKYPMTEELKNKFKELPQNISEIEELTANYSAKLEFYDCDPELEKDFKKKEADL